VKIAGQIHAESGGAIGLWPLFNLVKWVDEMFGLGDDELIAEVDMLVLQRRAEINFSRDKTLDTLSFNALARMAGINLKKLLSEVKRSVAVARRK